MKSLALGVVLAAALALDARAEPDPAATFTRRCSGCHTFGNGDRVGPDLKGVTERHSRQWLASWISSSERVIRTGDREAVALFRKYRQQRMPDQALLQDEVAALIDYLAAGGPEADLRKRDRRAETATSEEIELGRSLFAGEQPFAGGGASCGACHRLSAAGTTGGNLGPDLSAAYRRFHDRGLAALFGRGCFPRVDTTGQRTSLTDAESFALRAFLLQAGANPPVATVPVRSTRK